MYAWRYVPGSSRRRAARRSIQRPDITRISCGSCDAQRHTSTTRSIHLQKTERCNCTTVRLAYLRLETMRVHNRVVYEVCLGASENLAASTGVPLVDFREEPIMAKESSRASSPRISSCIHGIARSMRQRCMKVAQHSARLIHL